MSDKPTNPLTIVQLTARNVMNLKAVRITPDKNVVVLTGKNGAGKSNILDVIQSMLEGLKLKMPIRIGEDRADAELDLGEIKIRKRWTAKGEGIEVYRVLEDGKKQTYSSPQTLLNELTAKMLDPMKLYQLMKDDPKKFHETLGKLVGLDFTDLKQEELAIREERKAVNDKIRAAIAQINEMPAPDPNTPDEEITFRDKLNDLNRLREKRDIHDRAQRDVALLRRSIDDKRERIDDIEKQIAELGQERAGLIIQCGDLERDCEKAINALPEKITPEQILAAQAEIEKVEDTNKIIRHAIRYRRAVKESEKARAESDALTQKLERLEQDKQTRIGACKFPVDGLSMTEDQVLFEGKPLEVASDGQKIIIFTKMAMAMSPTVKVLLVRDGSLLDSQGFKTLCDIASAEGYQIFAEKVDESGTVGVFIENGEITAIDGKKIAVECDHQEVEHGNCAACGKAVNETDKTGENSDGDIAPAAVEQGA